MADHLARKIFRLLLVDRNLLALIAVKSPIENNTIAFLGRLALSFDLRQQFDAGLNSHRMNSSTMEAPDSRLFPLHFSANCDFTSGENSRIGSAAPFGVHRGLQSRQNSSIRSQGLVSPPICNLTGPMRRILPRELASVMPLTNKFARRA